MKKRAVSIFLALAMILSVMAVPTTALAEGADGGAASVDKAPLLNKINEALAVDQKEYAPEGVEKLQNAILEAQSVYAKANTTQEEVDAQVAALDTALDALVKAEHDAVAPGNQQPLQETPMEPVDKSGLLEAIDTAAKIDGGLFTKDSFSALQAAISATQGVYDNAEALAEDIAGQLTALQNAVNALKEAKVTKTGTAKVTAWDVDKDEPSALAGLLKADTVLEEINGYVYATLTFLPADGVKGTDLHDISTYANKDAKVYASKVSADEGAGVSVVKARIIGDNVKTDILIGGNETVKTVRLYLENITWEGEETAEPEKEPEISAQQRAQEENAPMVLQANLLADGFYGIPDYIIYSTAAGTTRHATTDGIRAIDMKVDNGQMTVTVYMKGYSTGNNMWITNIVNIQGNTSVTASVMERDSNGHVTIFRFTIPYTEERIAMGLPTTGSSLTTARYLRMDLTTAIAKADKYLLYTALKEANAVKELGKGSFTDASWNALLNAIQTAQDVFDNTSAPQSDVNAQVGLVHDAIDALITESAPVDKTVLSAKILEAERLTKDDHTDASWDALQAALVEAKATAEKEDATQFEVNQKARALQAALDGRAYNSSVVSIPDINLKKTILDSLNISCENDEEAVAAVITENMMATLTVLDASNQDIKDAKGLEKAVNLESLNLSGNPLDDASRATSSFGGFFQSFSAFSKLKYLDLSNCRLGDNSLGISGSNPMIPGDILALRNCLPNLPSIESVDLSDNGLVSAFQFTYNGRFEYLKSLDLSGNRFNQIINFDGSKFPVLEMLDLSDNYLHWDEAAGSWVEPLMLAGNIVKHNNQKNLGDLFSVQQNNKASVSNSFYYIKADNDTRTLTLGDFSGDTVVSFMGFGMQLTTKVAAGDTKVTAATVFGPYTIANDGMLLTLSGYAPGSYEVPVTVMHLGGDTREYKLKFNVVPVPSGGADSAGIVDSYLQAVVCNKLGVAASHVVTKTEMAGMTGSLIAMNVRDAQGIQYANGLTSLKLKGNFTELPDLSGLTALTSLSLLSDDLEHAPDLSALTALRSLTICGADDGFPNLTNQTALTTLILDNVGAKDYPVGMSSTIKTFEVDRANGKIFGVPGQLTGLTEFRFLPNTDGEGHVAAQVSRAAVDLTNIKNVTAPGSLSVTIGNGTTAVTGLSAQSAALQSFYIYFDPEGETVFPEGLEDVPNLTGSLVIGNNMSGELPDEYAQLTKVTRLTLSGRYADVPPEIASMTSLTYLDMQSCGLARFTTDLSNTKLTALNLWGDQLNQMPSADLLPTTLGELNLAGNLIAKVDDATAAGYAKMTALKTLNFEGDPLVVFPSTLIKNLPALTSLNTRFGRYADIPADSFDNSTALGTVRLGHAIMVNRNASGVMSFMEGTGGAAAVAKLKTYLPNANVTMEAGTEANFAYANLVGLTSSVGTIPEAPYSARTLSLSVPEATSSVALTPDALLPDTVITVNGQEYTEGQAIRIDNLVKGSNVVTLSCRNDFQNYLLTNTTAVYTLNIFVGDYVNDDFPAQGHTYSVKYRLYKSGRGDALSMADSYFTKTATVRYKDGLFAIAFTTTKSSWIPDMHYYMDGELRAAELLEKNNTTDHATYRIYAYNLEDIVVINPFVTPMGYAPICDLRFNTQEIIDITDTLPSVDKTDLVAAINRAAAELRKSIYTDASYNALKAASDAAKTVNAAAGATEEEVAAATSALNSAIDGLRVDPAKLANKASLKAALDEAKAIRKGSHTDTAWNALRDAIADAQAVYDTLEAKQSEVDAAARALKTAITLFGSSGEASKLDKDNLQDGAYTLNADMIKINRRDYSMSNDAIGHNITLTVRNGVYYITVEFRGLNVDGDFGYLSRLKYYGAGFSYDNYGNPQGTVILATVLSYQKDTNGNNIVDQYNDADNPYPKHLQFPLVNKAGYEGNFVPLQVFVPIMEAISTGSGTQDVLMRLDWTTLKTGSAANPDIPTDPANPDTPSADKSVLSAKLAEAKAIKQGDYTDASYQILQNAISVAQGIMDSPYAMQSEVNEQVKALDNAIAGLTRRPKDTLDKDNLQDGKYEVRVDLWHATQNKASMGNGSLNHTGLIEAKNGKLYMSVSVHPMQVGTITASLATLQIRQANGSYVYADVIANNIAGGKPSAFRFALPSTSTYIPVKVDPQVKVMGDDPVDARLRISWDTLVKVSDDTKVSGNTKLTVGSVEEGVVASDAASLADQATGVKLEAEANVLPEGTTMSVTPILNGADYEKAKLALEEIGGNFALYDITLLGPDNAAIQPNGAVKISIPVPEGMDAGLIVVYRINADGTKTLIESTIENGYVVFLTNHFSLYAIVEKADEPALAGPVGDNTTVDAVGGEPADLVNAAAPGSNGLSFLWWLIPIAVAAAGVTIFIVRRKLKTRGITA